MYSALTAMETSRVRESRGIIEGGRKKPSDFRSDARAEGNKK